MTGSEPALNRLTLRFDNGALEGAFRAAEGARSVQIMRRVLLGTMVLMLVLGAVLDTWASPELRSHASTMQVALYANTLLLIGYALSHLAPVQRHAQWAVAVLCVLFAAGVASGHKLLPTEFVTHRGFMFVVLHLFNVYSMLRLRFPVATATGFGSLLAYVGVVGASGLLSRDDLARHLFWVLLANIWGMAICYRLDLSTRREFAAREDLARERHRSETLLLNILPASIAARLKESQESIAEQRESVTVLFADLVGFTPLASRKTPAQLVTLLNRVFSEFDALAKAHGLEKIKTIGDAYMAAAGLPTPNPDHAACAAQMALAMVATVQRLTTETGEPLSVRVGLHSGPVVAGVIGTSKFSYDLWGDTVNMASRMESHGPAGGVHCSSATAALLDSRFRVLSRGSTEVKGKGPMETFLVTSR